MATARSAVGRSLNTFIITVQALERPNEIRAEFTVPSIRHADLDPYTPIQHISEVSFERLQQLASRALGSAIATAFSYRHPRTGDRLEIAGQDDLWGALSCACAYGLTELTLEHSMFNVYIRGMFHHDPNLHMI